MLIVETPTKIGRLDNDRRLLNGRRTSDACDISSDVEIINNSITLRHLGDVI